MQIIYAAPFILLSLICFFVCLAVPFLRRFAFRALVAPVAFGFCGIVGWIIFAVAGFHLELALGPMTGIRLVFAALIFYVLPGSVGAWLAVLIVKKVEEIALKIPGAWQLALRVVVSLICFALASLIGLGFIGRWLGPNSLTTELGLAVVFGALIGFAGYFLARTVQRRASGHVQNMV
jgi:GNAT superfamily N-acetyltransferase